MAHSQKKLTDRPGGNKYGTYYKDFNSIVLNMPPKLKSLGRGLKETKRMMH